ncbi:DUF962 domain-containing protein [Mucilaginibacter gynuensis]|uniref:DUF962 domain-containing protein n=1 Tax=Mucilaginibacter gynuensis TaxID=1302236 RepID=A0ABP8GX25_9SPHI
MAQLKKTSTANQPAQPQQRPIDKEFAAYSASHQSPANNIIHWICIPLFFLGLFGLLWSIPFPHIKILGKYNGFFNWASFLIALSIYYYYKLSPVLSYFILFTLFGFSYVIIQLEQLQKAGGPMLWQISGAMLVLSLIGIIVGNNMETTKPNIGKQLKSLAIAPIFLWHLIVNKLGVKF